MGRDYFTMTFLAQVALAFSLLATTLAQDGPVVEVEQGSLVGVTETFQESEFLGVNKTVDVFKGIPFAEPPVGPLRFEPPVAKQPWDGTWNATYFRDACVQVPSGTSLAMSEDCLHLNIFAPNPKTPGGVAVMVWIHGGGFTIGTAAEPYYMGHPLVALGDVIIVTINYRLSVFGFLTTADDVAPGNVGLKDQLLALQWIKQNIEAFGGDSERITIFGESAGSASVSWLVLSQQTAGLFNQAIFQSGTAFSPWAFSENREMLRRQAFQLGEKLDCRAPESTTLLNYLKGRDSTALLTASVEMYFRTIPVVDGTFVDDTPANLYAMGRYNRVRILLGTTADEGTLSLYINPLMAEFANSEEAPFISKEMFEQLVPADLNVYYGVNNAYLVDAIRMRYVDWSQADYSDADYFRAYVDYTTDYLFACGTNQVARFHAQGGDVVYLYEMTLVPSRSPLVVNGTGPGWLGAAHGVDISFVFGVPFMEFEASQFSFLDEERVLSVQFMEYWTNFAKTGNPNSPSDSDGDLWPRFTIPELEYKVLDLNLTTSRALKSDECYFWNSYVPRMKSMLGELNAVERDWRQAFSTWKYTDMENWREQFNRYKAAAASING